MDVHKDSIDVAIAESGRRGEVRHWGVIGGDRAALDKALRKLVSLLAKYLRTSTSSTQRPPRSQIPLRTARSA
jgi:hypothetical protein